MLTVLMTGRIEHVEVHNGAFYHIITTPAPDSYSRPSTYKVRSQLQLGNEGQEITIEATFSGTVSQRQYKDKVTGVNKVFREGNVFIDGRNPQSKPQVKSA